MAGRDEGEEPSRGGERPDPSGGGERPVRSDRARGDGPAETGVTVAGGPAPTAVRAQDFREHLPGLEPERHTTDWGRSELVEGVLERTVYDFLYHYWFRVEVDGVENVPADGPALLIANRAGALPADAAMIAAALRREHSTPRPLHFATQRPLGSVPGLDMLMVKAGGVTAHPANLHRLLFDERQLVLGFPEGHASKPLRERYRVRRFAQLDLVGSALRARAPIVPVAVLGGEEAAPVVGRLPGRSWLGRLAGVPLRALPRPALGIAVPLPAKFRIRFLRPVDPDGWAPELPDAAGGAEAGTSAVQALGDDLRALIQENLFEMLGQRRSIWLG